MLSLFAPLLVALVLIALARPARHRIGWLALLAVVTPCVLATPVASTSLMDRWGATRPVTRAAMEDVGAIVVIGGGLRRNAPEYGGPALNRLGIDRVRYGALLSRQTGIPMLVSGGRWDDLAVTEAALLARTAVEESGAVVRWAEDASTNTRGNAEQTARLLAPEGIRRIALVAHAFDMPRAAREFRAVGFEVVEAPIGLDRADGSRWQHYVPQLEALERTHFVIYEMLATVRNWFRPPAARPAWPERPQVG